MTAAGPPDLRAAAVVPPTQDDPVVAPDGATSDGTTLPAEEPAPVTDVFATVEVVEELRGRGGQARHLYRCRTRVTVGASPAGSDVVVKVYPTPPDHDVICELWRRAVDTPGVMPLLAAEVVGNWAYEMTPYASRGSLADGLSPDARLALGDLRRVVEQVSAALSALHELRTDDASLRMIHRDVKPANLLRLANGVDIALTDFGVARVQRHEREYLPFVGTPYYAPPEAVANSVYQAWDWWSLGITVLELAVGTNPFFIGSALMAVEGVKELLVQSGAPRPTLPPEWQVLLDGLLHQTARERWNHEDVLLWLADIGPDGCALDPSRFAPPSPPVDVPVGGSSPGSPDGRLRPSFRMGGVAYDHPVALAAALVDDWERATREVVVGRRWQDLQSWARAWSAELGDAVDEVHRGFVVPRRHADRTLAELVVRLDPRSAPVFRGSSVTVEGLDRLSEDAFDRGGHGHEVLRRLRESGALTAFAAAPGQEPLAAVDEIWQRWLELAEARVDSVFAAHLPDREAADELGTAELSAMLLRCVVNANAAHVLEDQARLTTTRRRRQLPWFADLIRSAHGPDAPPYRALMVLLAGLADDPDLDAGRASGRWPWSRGGAARSEPASTPAPAPQAPPRPAPTPRPAPVPRAVQRPRVSPTPRPAPRPRVLGHYGPSTAPRPTPAPRSAPVPRPLPPPRSAPGRPGDRPSDRGVSTPTGGRHR